MKTKFNFPLIGLSIILLVLIQSFTAIAQKQSTIPDGKLTTEVLFDQSSLFSFEPPVLSQEFMDLPMNTCMAADDFTVPAGEEWIIESMFFHGEYIGPEFIDLVNIFIYMDDFGIPGPEIISFPGIPCFPDNSGTIDVILPGAPPLTEGTYWISVQAVLPSFFGEWRWYKQMAPVSGYELMWQNPGGGLGGPPFWEPGFMIWPGQNDWDLEFSMSGIRMILGPPMTIDSYFPTSCVPGDEIHIFGTNLGTFAPDAMIEIDGVPYHEDDYYWINDTIIFELPPVPGGDSITLKLLNGPDISNEIKLAFSLPDTAWFYQPQEGEYVYWDHLLMQGVSESPLDKIDSAKFYYRVAGDLIWNYLGTDTCGADETMGTYHSFGPGNGWAWEWDVSGFSHDTVELKVEMFDNFGFFQEGFSHVIIDPTPPIPFILEDSSDLVASFSLELDLINIWMEILADELAKSIVLCGRFWTVDSARILEGKSQWDIHIVTRSGDSLKDDICAPTSGASCLKWLAGKYNPQSGLQNRDFENLVRELTSKSETKNNIGTKPTGIANGMKDVYKSATGKDLKTDVYGGPNSNNTTNRMISDFNKGKDVLINIWQRVKDTIEGDIDTAAHFVAMSSYHQQSYLFWDENQGKMVGGSNTMVDFMDPATGKKTWSLLTNDEPPQFIFYNLDDSLRQGNAFIRNVVTAKPETGSKKSDPPIVHFQTIPITEPGIYEVSIPLEDLQPGHLQLMAYTLDENGDTLAEYISGAHIDAYRPWALLDSDTRFGEPPFAVNFINRSVPLDSVTYCEWDFGDGNLSYEMEPSHTYQNAGIFDVKLIVSDGVQYDTIIEENYIQSGINLDLKVFLEGSYVGDTMTTLLNPDYLPLSQPYSGSPWNYVGSEQVDSMPNASITDWVLIEIRETAGDVTTAIPATSIASQAGFILNNGSVVGIDGRSYLYMNIDIAENLFAVVHHRNHLPIISANALQMQSGIFTLDFSTSPTTTFGTENSMVDLGNGNWGMIAGNAIAGNQVDNVDKNDSWISTQGSVGYLNADANLDGLVDDNDLLNYWIPNSGKSSRVPE